MEKRGLFVKKSTKVVDDNFFFRIFERYFAIVGSFSTRGTEMNGPPTKATRK